MESNTIQELASSMKCIEQIVYMNNDVVEKLKKNEKELVYQGIAEICTMIEKLINQLHRNTEVHGINISEINPIIGEMFQAMESGDVIFLKDLFEFELNEKMYEWNGILESCI